MPEQLTDTLPEGWTTIGPSGRITFEQIGDFWLSELSLDDYLLLVDRLIEWAHDHDYQLVALSHFYHWSDEAERFFSYQFNAYREAGFRSSSMDIRRRHNGQSMVYGDLIGHACPNCGEARVANEYEDCESCQPNYCGNCGEEPVEYEGDYCQYCDEEHVDPETCETFDANESQETLPDLGFTPREFNDERGVRLVSIELEFANDPTSVARTLYRRGLSSVVHVDDYSANHDGESCVKRDGSVGGGGEMVISKVDLTDENDLRRMWHSVNVLREHVKDGTNALDMRCGCHIHVDMRKRPLNEMFTTLNVYNFLEDILYRMAAANYKYHRMENGNSYGRVTPKGMSKSRIRQFTGREYWGLNFGNYCGYRYYCNCGVGFDRADLCTCENRGKPTLEFRLWNTTANSIKLHAFVALSQALCVYGENRDISSDELEPLEYNRQARLRFNSEEHAREYASRLVWMFQNLPLNAAERDSIRYCIRKSDIGEALEQARGWLEDELINGLMNDGADELLDIGPYEPAQPLLFEPEPAEPELPVEEFHQEYELHWDFTSQRVERLAVPDYYHCGQPCDLCSRNVTWPDWAMACSDSLIPNGGGSGYPVFLNRAGRLCRENGRWISRNVLDMGRLGRIGLHYDQPAVRDTYASAMEEF